jgi:carboxyl-terminal processing protease
MGAMSRRTRTLVFLISTPLVVLVLVGGLLGAVQAPDGKTPQHLRVFGDVYNYIFEAYVEPVGAETVMDGAMRGLTDGLDPMTSYLMPDEVRLLESNAPAPAGDVGLTVTHQYYLKVIGVRDGSPAAKAGLQSGDFVRAIDGKPTRDMSTFSGTRLLRGTVGSSVSLLVIRSNPSDPHPIALVREAAKPDRVTSRTLPGGEAYVRVASFDSGAAQALGAAVRGLGTTADAGVLIDLRDLADGAPSEGIAAARLFVKEGVLATRISRNAEPAITRASAGDGALAMKVVLLVSNGTARAAEVFASALQSNKRGDLVGEPTAGLASAQKLVKLSDGHGLLLTTERYAQADKVPLDGRGLRPTVAIETRRVEFGLPQPTGDPTLDKAVDLLRGRVTADAKIAAEAQGSQTGGERQRVNLPPTVPPQQAPTPNRPLPSSPR